MNFRQILISIAAIVFLLALGFSLGADEPPAKPTPSEDTPSTEIPAKPTGTQDEPDVASSGLLDSLWTKVRSIMISDEEVSQADEPRYSATAGIRGARSMRELLKPIWKGKGKRGYLPADVRLYEKAKACYEKGEYDSALLSLTEFHKIYKYSSLRPQAQIMLALCHAKKDNKPEAIKALDEFLKTYPDHPLKPDVKQLKTQLVKETETSKE
jgi:TolA-binding protein